MNVLLKKATIVFKGHPLHLKKRDILIKKGKIAEIKSAIKSSNTNVISSPDLCVSPGWVDLRANFREPGHEHKEDLTSGLNAASAGGFTSVVTMPNTTPVIDNNTTIQFLINSSLNHTTQIKPAGAISKGLASEQLSEMADMKKSGAVAFTEDIHFLPNSNLLAKALEYSKTIGSSLFTFPHDETLVSDGQMHEGRTSTSLGVKGIPYLSEEVQLSRDIQLLRHYGGKIHVSAISSKGSVELIKSAKKEGLNITCGIHAFQLSFTDEDVNSFDSRFKVLPPFRSEADRKALIKGLLDGTIDAVCSGHEPEDVEEKKREFTEAAFGISGIETAYSSMNSAKGNKLTTEELVEKLSTKPREIIGLPLGDISTNIQADLTVFDPSEDWHFTRDQLISKSKNTPFNEVSFKGKVLGVINNGRTYFGALK